ncbi:MAG: hypothetical protein M0Q43_14170 [Methanothrix sp.]|jgi:hypothetical protein|nr:hypothetical protein [Methanothrix sp.]
MYKKIEILAIAAMLLLTVGFADGIAAHSKQETVERMPIPDVLAANNSENHLVPVVTPLDSGTGYLGDITIQGTAISKFDRIGAWGWNVYVDNVVEGPTEMKDKTISIYLTSADPTVYPRGTIDSNINVGDIVEAYGGSASGYDISLTGSANYYLKYLGLPVTAAHGTAPPGMGEAIRNTTVVPAVWPVEAQEPSTPTQSVTPELSQNYVIVTDNLISKPSYLVTENGQKMAITWLTPGVGYVSSEYAPQTYGVNLNDIFKAVGDAAAELGCWSGCRHSSGTQCIDDCRAAEGLKTS